MGPTSQQVGCGVSLQGPGSALLHGAAFWSGVGTTSRGRGGAYTSSRSGVGWMSRSFCSPEGKLPLHLRGRVCRHLAFAARVGCARSVSRGEKRVIRPESPDEEPECSPPSTSWTGGTTQGKSSLSLLSSDPIPLPLESSIHFFGPGSSKHSIEFKRLYCLPSWLPSPRRDRRQPVSCASEPETFFTCAHASQTRVIAHSCLTHTVCFHASYAGFCICLFFISP